MRRLLVTILLAALCVATWGCQSSGGHDAGATPSPEPNPPTFGPRPGA